MNILKKAISTRPRLKIKTGLKAGFDARSYCLQGCVTKADQCEQMGMSNCDLLATSCLNSCVYADVLT